MHCNVCGVLLHPANPSICEKHCYGHCATHSNETNRCPFCEEDVNEKDLPPWTCFFCGHNYANDGASGTIEGKPACCECMEKAGIIEGGE